MTTTRLPASRLLGPTSGDPAPVGVHALVSALAPYVATSHTFVIDVAAAAETRAAFALLLRDLETETGNLLPTRLPLPAAVVIPGALARSAASHPVAVADAVAARHLPLGITAIAALAPYAATSHVFGIDRDLKTPMVSDAVAGSRARHLPLGITAIAALAPYAATSHVFGIDRDLKTPMVSDAVAGSRARHLPLGITAIAASRSAVPLLNAAITAYSTSIILSDASTTSTTDPGDLLAPIALAVPVVSDEGRLLNLMHSMKMNVNRELRVLKRDLRVIKREVKLSAGLKRVAGFWFTFAMFNEMSQGVREFRVRFEELLHLLNSLNQHMMGVLSDSHGWVLEAVAYP